MTKRFAGRIPDRVDALVAGAGPAGLSAALHLARVGASVLLVDVRLRIGHPARCGEITGKNFFELLGLERRQEWVRLEIARRPRSSKRVLVLDRPRCEEGLAAVVAGMGGWVRAGTTVVGVGEFDGRERIVTLARGRERHAVRAGVVVAADGASSTVGRMAGLDTRLPLSGVAPGLAFRVDGCELAHPEAMIIQPLPPPYPPVPYYFWVIPNGPDSANVGLGLSGREGPRAPELLRRLLAASPDVRGGRVVETLAGVIPDVRPLQRPVRDGLVVVGGAARLINPLNGGGIRLAIRSGGAAARAIEKRAAVGPFTEQALWPEYEQLVRHQVEKLEKQWKERERLESRVRSKGGLQSRGRR
ncbi:MAG: NAD(P)/FAD-dependent oxidoreductase [Polyangia bacterium]